MATTEVELRALVFDLDQTLLDQASASQAAVVDWASSLDIVDSDVSTRWAQISSRHYARYQLREISFEDQRRERVREFLGRSFTDAEASRVFRGYLERYEAGWMLFPDAVPALRRAREAGHSVAILTNGDRDQQLRKLDRFGLASEIDLLLCSSELAFGKPHPSAFSAVTDALGVTAQESIMIGDSFRNDYQGARVFGMHAILVDRQGTHSDAGVESVNSLAELKY